MTCFFEIVEAMLHLKLEVKHKYRWWASAHAVFLQELHRTWLVRLIMIMTLFLPATFMDVQTEVLQWKSQNSFIWFGLCDINCHRYM